MPVIASNLGRIGRGARSGFLSIGRAGASTFTAIGRVGASVVRAGLGVGEAATRTPGVLDIPAGARDLGRRLGIDTPSEALLSIGLPIAAAAAGTVGGILLGRTAGPSEAAPVTGGMGSGAPRARRARSKRASGRRRKAKARRSRTPRRTAKGRFVARGGHRKRGRPGPSHPHGSHSHKIVSFKTKDGRTVRFKRK